MQQTNQRPCSKSDKHFLLLVQGVKEREIILLLYLIVFICNALLSKIDMGSSEKHSVSCFSL